MTAGDTAGSTVTEIITGPGSGGGPLVRVFNTQAQSILDFPVYDETFKGGIRVSAGNVKPDYPKDEILTIPASYGPSHVRLVANTGGNITDYVYLESWRHGLDGSRKFRRCASSFTVYPSHRGTPGAKDRLH